MRSHLYILMHISHAVDVLQAVQNLDSNGAGGLCVKLLLVQVVQDPLEVRAKPWQHQETKLVSFSLVAPVSDVPMENISRHKLTSRMRLNWLSVTCTCRYLILEMEGTDRGTDTPFGQMLKH